MTAQEVAAALPLIEVLKARCRAVSMLDAIVSPNSAHRVHTFVDEWGGGASALEIRDARGGDCFVVFTPDGAFIKGQDQTSPMAPGRSRTPGPWPGVVDDVPVAFADLLTEPLFTGRDGHLEATFCLWRQHGDPQWQTGAVHYVGIDGRADPDGAWRLLGVLTDPPGARTRPSRPRDAGSIPTSTLSITLSDSVR